jgi:hypothetical protein
MAQIYQPFPGQQRPPIRLDDPSDLRHLLRTAIVDHIIPMRRQIESLSEEVVRERRERESLVEQLQFSQQLVNQRLDDICHSLFVHGITLDRPSQTQRSPAPYPPDNGVGRQLLEDIGIPRERNPYIRDEPSYPPPEMLPPEEDIPQFLPPGVWQRLVQQDEDDMHARMAAPGRLDPVTGRMVH